MSTKALREALDLMKEIQGYSSADVHAAAMAEVAAIRKAAKRVATDGYLYTIRQDGYGSVADVLESIAKEET